MRTPANCQPDMEEFLKLSNLWQCSISQCLADGKAMKSHSCLNQNKQPYCTNQLSWQFRTTSRESLVALWKKSIQQAVSLISWRHRNMVHLSFVVPCRELITRGMEDSIHFLLLGTNDPGFSWLPYFLVGGLNPSEKIWKSVGALFPIHGKIKNDPNRQPVLHCLYSLGSLGSPYLPWDTQGYQPHSQIG